MHPHRRSRERHLRTFLLGSGARDAFLVRTCVNRRAGDGKHIVADEMGETAIKGLHRIEVRTSDGEQDQALLEVRYRKIRVLPPLGKWKRYPPLTLTVIHAEEVGEPRSRKRISWKLITDLPVQSKQQAIEKLEWYAMRRKIEVFHKILKLGGRAEDSRLRTAQRLANLISVFRCRDDRARRRHRHRLHALACLRPTCERARRCRGSRQCKVLQTST